MKHRALTLTVGTLQCGHTVWRKKKRKNPREREREREREYRDRDKEPNTTKKN